MHKKFFALLDESPVEGGNGNPSQPPVVAETMVNAQRTEREVDLEQELQITRTERDSHANRVRKLETDVSHLQDENQRLRQPQTQKPAAEADTRSDLERWMDGE